MIKKIIHNSIVIAIIIYDSYEQEGIKYFSPAEYPLQLGYMKRQEGYQVSPHIHKPAERKTFITQEVLFIKSGKVRVDFYSPEKEFIESCKLSAGDTVLFAEGGHGLEVMQEAVILEVKNGPFVEGADKERFENKEGKDDTR